MANPQIENGHVDLANDLVEALAKIRLSGEESQILWSILRKTYGWHKKEDHISLSQFSLMTGIKRQNVLRALTKLASKKIIAVIKKDDSIINMYRIQKDFDNWQPLSKKITTPKTVINIDKRGESKMMHTKENNTKEIHIEPVIKKDDTPNPNIKTFIDYWHVSFKSKFSQPYIFNGAKEGTLIKSLLKTIALEDLKTKAEIFFTCNDDFIKKSGYTIGVFYSQINKLSTMKKSKWK